MSGLKSKITGFILLSAVLVTTYSLLGKKNSEVVIYVSHDQDYSQPILENFEKETGITVKAVYDTEASKTVGLTNRLIAEKNNPQADVFWNNEVTRTIQLKKEGVLDQYKPKNYDKLASVYRDKEGYWTGFAARARVLVVNTKQVDKKNIPDSLEDLTNKNFTGKVTIADPRFGTTGSHMAALYTVWGKEKFENFFRQLKKNGIDIASSNGQTRDKVVEGSKWIGFTDTDDANDAIINKKPISAVYPDQQKDSIGTLVIPNTVMLIKGANNAENAKKLIDYLVSENAESKLAYAKSAQMPLLPKVDRPQNIPAVETIKPIAADWEKIYENLKPVMEFFEKEILE